LYASAQYNDALVLLESLLSDNNNNNNNNNNQLKAELFDTLGLVHSALKQWDKSQSFFQVID
jgi:hypothetical protein